MPSSARILAISGSNRADSFNRKVLAIAAQGALKSGAQVTPQVTMLDLREHELPLYDQDLEAKDGLPASVLTLKKIFLDHQGLLIASPEYNSSITPLLKNLIDWVSRSAAGEGGLAAFRGKVAGIVSASPGALGGIRSLAQLRVILGNIGVLVLTEQATLPKAGEAFNADGSLVDAKKQDAFEMVGRKLAEMVVKLNA